MAFGSFSFFLFFILCLAASVASAARPPESLLMIQSAVSLFRLAPLISSSRSDRHRLLLVGQGIAGRRPAGKDRPYGRLPPARRGTLPTTSTRTSCCPTLPRSCMPWEPSRPRVRPHPHAPGRVLLTFQAIAYVADVYRGGTRGPYPPTWTTCLTDLLPVHRLRHHPAAEVFQRNWPRPPIRDLDWGNPSWSWAIRMTWWRTFLGPIADQVFPDGAPPRLRPGNGPEPGPTPCNRFRLRRVLQLQPRRGPSWATGSRTTSASPTPPSASRTSAALALNSRLAARLPVHTLGATPRRRPHQPETAADHAHRRLWHERHGCS